MSKKSRRRNKKILGALALLGTGLALANRGKGTGVSGSDKAKFTSDAAYSMPKNDIEFKETVVSTPKTIMDSMPARPKKNPLSKRVTDKGEVYTIKGGNTGVGNPKTAFVGDKYIYRDGKPYTKGRFGTFAAQKQMERGALPPQLRVPKIKNPYQGSMSGLAYGDFAAKKGGRATKSGFKKTGAAKRGFGRAYKGGK
jgi:hypothetical protein